MHNVISRNATHKNPKQIVNVRWIHQKLKQENCEKWKFTDCNWKLWIMIMIIVIMIIKIKGDNNDQNNGDNSNDNVH